MRDHKMMYGIYLRASILASLLVVIAVFLIVPYAETEPYKLKKEIGQTLETISIEIDRQIEPPPIERPKVAIAAPTNEIVEDVVETIVTTGFQEEIIRTIPDGPEIEIIPFYSVEIKPQPIAMPKPDYPQLAQRAGIEGTCVVKMLVDIDGSVADVVIMKSSGSALLDEAAVRAAKESKFTPARQRDKFVRVWVARPIEFKLKAGA